MKTYTVLWEIEIDAENHKQAAKMALKIQRDPESIGTFFEVSDKDGLVIVAFEKENI